MKKKERARERRIAENASGACMLARASLWKCAPRRTTLYSLWEWSRSICVIHTGLPGRRIGVRQQRKWEHMRLTSNYRSVSLVMLRGRSSSNVAADPPEPHCPRVCVSACLSVLVWCTCICFPKTGREGFTETMRPGFIKAAFLICQGCSFFRLGIKFA